MPNPITVIIAFLIGLVVILHRISLVIDGAISPRAGFSREENYSPYDHIIKRHAASAVTVDHTYHSPAMLKMAGHLEEQDLGQHNVDWIGAERPTWLADRESSKVPATDPGLAPSAIRAALKPAPVLVRVTGPRGLGYRVAIALPTSAPARKRTRRASRKLSAKPA